ncbi:HlyD family efflux transporter periplasmic adaptor subunit [Bradyrhizobium sp.]|uniref:HlyD family efflux transporter periplasmic adaptor subunit n=2 Tax=Bradyrhizobium sp. TaxID=376 RepID=UPI0028FDECBB|nr:HlyD family efflux transporter periplasmic adaptor subunit [Bradyrhizobium sp.]MDU2926199.1 HlyD family efflux transporter periplasmic adaptor subunit [Bradyrhizobium sp.]MDU6614083.1 HlyD family efflux transporter periplasmic adaptor subunit [Bradyrhizobium sp.]MDU6829649.1 HlyD family efflux transporter periplasmic adaptor subunit [Bradyrhizobium sp.]
MFARSRYRPHAAHLIRTGFGTLAYLAQRAIAGFGSRRRLVYATMTGAALLGAAGWYHLTLTIDLVSTNDAVVQMDAKSDTAYVVAYFDDRHATRIAAGQPVSIDIKGPPDRTLSGHVVEVSEKTALLRLSGEDGGSMHASEIMIPVLIAFDDVIDAATFPASASVIPTINTKPRDGDLRAASPVCVCRFPIPMSGLKITDLP